MSHAGSAHTTPPHRPGRHRRTANNEAAWTPTVDPEASGGRHRAPDAPTEEIPPVGSLSGTLPTTAPAMPSAGENVSRRPRGDERPRTAARSAATARRPRRASAPAGSTGEPAAGHPDLPAQVPAEAVPPSHSDDQPDIPAQKTGSREAATSDEPGQTAGRNSAEPDAPKPPQRTRVTLTPATEETEDVRVYVAPPPGGLSKFDLGNVPASVTPPRSWRKAAWFATMSSCGVAVALVLAGSYLVGQSPHTTDVEGWTGFRGQPPVMHDEGIADRDPDDGGPTRSAPGSSSSEPQRIADMADITDTSNSGNTTPGGTTPSAKPSTPDTPTSPGDSTKPTSPPEKPPPVTAPREIRRDSIFNFPPDAKTMGDRSETFLNEITEHPEVAHAQTGGDLYAQGPEALAKRYADIAYFEVKHIYIDQKNRVTVNTVNVVYQDGTSETQQCTLRFEEGDKITQDCR